MTPTLKTIRLYGALGAEFGRLHRLAVGSAAEAVRALCALLPGFERRMLDSGDQGVRYACFIGRRNLAEDEFGLPAGQDEIRIAPMPAGAKRGGFPGDPGRGHDRGQLHSRAERGHVVRHHRHLVRRAGVHGRRHGAERRGAAADAAATPAQRQDGPDNGASYNFNGPVNTTAQGNPVPVIYGEMIVGSATISAGIYSEDQA